MAITVEVMSPKGDVVFTAYYEDRTIDDRKLELNAQKFFFLTFTNY